MADAKRTMKVIWAVDALDPFPEAVQKIAQALSRFEKNATVEVYPVFMLSPEQLGIATDLTESNFEQYVETGAKKALEQYVQTVRMPGLKKPETLLNHRYSLKESVRKFSSYAEKKGFDFAVVGTHGRKGLHRMATGSFTEELLLQSKIPVLVVGPASEIAQSAEARVLIPSDFSDLDSPFFRDAFSLTARLGAKATLLHAIPRPVEAFLESGVYLFSGSWVPISTYLTEAKSKQEERAEQVQELARKSGIECDHVIDQKCSSVTESIIDYAKGHPTSLIVMEAQSGPLASSLLGSVTRKVVRDAPCPVWVTRSRK